MLKLRKTVTVLLAASMLLSMCSCKKSGADILFDGFRIKWTDTCLFENLDKMGKLGLKDDFYAAVNYDWAKDQKEDYSDSISAFGEVMRTVRSRKRAIIDDRSIRNKNVELLRIADGLFNDWDYRNSMGVEPLKKYLGYIDQIKTIDDVSEYMLDNEKNPFAVMLVKITDRNSEKLDDYRALCITKPDLMLDKDSYYVLMDRDAYIEKDKVEKKLDYLLKRCGYSDKDAKAVINGAFGFEDKLVHLDYTDFATDREAYTKDYVLENAGGYPLKDLLSHYKITNCNNYMGEMSFLSRLDTIYNQNNVGNMKDYFKARLMLESIRYLDKEAFEFDEDSNVDRSDKFAERVNRDKDFYFFRQIEKTPLTAAIDQAYLDCYYDEDMHKEIKEFVRLLKEKYQILIDASPNLTEESKKAVRDKLDKMGEKIILPDNKADFTGVELKSKEEGGSFLDAMCILSRIALEHTGEMVQHKYERNYWDIYDNDMSTTETNASYAQWLNTIYIRAGILADPIYSPDAPLEKKLGSFVPILGHEISHAFDSKGISRDATGRRTGLVSDSEMEFWNDKVKKIEDHFFGYMPFEGSNSYDTSNNISGEIIADAEGVKAAMMIGKDHKDFDYDLFFRSYAVSWRFMQSKQRHNDAVKTDPHPLEYIRINYTLAQFDEFMQTYGIKPGDGMYMDPSERILIW